MLKEAESDSQVSPPASESNNKAFTPDTQSTPDTDIDTPGQRDSGYVTDLSPLSFRSTPRQFNFSSEAEDNVFELSQEIDALELEERVFPFESEANEDGGASGDTDVTDQAVENILTDYGELGASRAVSDPINITRTRPRAPAPLSLGSDDYLNQSSVSSNINSIDVEFTNLTPEKPKGLKCLSRNAADSSEDKYEFCLSSQRSVATQTPPSLLPEAACCQSLHRSEDLQLTKGMPPQIITLCMKIILEVEFYFLKHCKHWASLKNTFVSPYPTLSKREGWVGRSGK